MKRWLTLGVLGLMVCAAAAQFDLRKLDPFKVATDTKKLVKGAAGIGLKEELAIGGSVAVEIVARYGGLLKDEEITRRVNLVGKSLGRYSDRPDLAYRFGVLQSTDVNAFSAPGGYIFITKGLYDLVENDDQLAGVLAHEIAHVTERHALKIISRGEFLEGLSGVATETGSAASPQDLRRFNAGIADVTKTLFEKGFDPKTEYAADEVGSHLAATVGYGPEGLKQCLETLQERQGNKPVFFSTHPPLKKRVAKLK